MLLVSRSRVNPTESWGFSVGGDTGRITRIDPASPFAGALRTGVHVASVNGVATPTTEDVINAVKAADTVLQLSLRDDSKLLETHKRQILRADAATSWGLKLNKHGVVVSVDPRSAAGESGIKEGDAIVEVNGDVISAATDVSKAMKGTSEVVLTVISKTATAEAPLETAAPADAAQQKGKRGRKKKVVDGEQSIIADSSNADKKENVIISSNNAGKRHTSDNPNRVEMSPRGNATISSNNVRDHNDNSSARDFSRDRRDEHRRFGSTRPEQRPPFSSHDRQPPHRPHFLRDGDRQQQHPSRQQTQLAQQQQPAGSASSPIPIVEIPAKRGFPSINRNLAEQYSFNELLGPLLERHKQLGDDAFLHPEVSPLVQRYQQRLQTFRHVNERTPEDAWGRAENWLKEGEVVTLMDAAHVHWSRGSNRWLVKGKEYQAAVPALSVVPGADMNQFDAWAAPVFSVSNSKRSNVGATTAMSVWMALPFVTFAAARGVVSRAEAQPNIPTAEVKEPAATEAAVADTLLPTGADELVAAIEKSDSAEASPKPEPKVVAKRFMSNRVAGLVMAADDAEALVLDKGADGEIVGVDAAAAFEHFMTGYDLREERPTTQLDANGKTVSVPDGFTRPQTQRSAHGDAIAEVVHVQFDVNDKKTAAYVIVFDSAKTYNLDRRVAALPCATVPPAFFDAEQTLQRQSLSTSACTLFHFGSVLGLARRNAGGSTNFLPLTFDQWKRATLKSVWRRK